MRRAGKSDEFSRILLLERLSIGMSRAQMTSINVSRSLRQAYVLRWVCL